MRYARLLITATALAAIASCVSPGALSNDAARSARIRADLVFLADDKREGREAGTRGYDAAAAYVVERFQEVGLSPSPGGEWYQQVPFRAHRRNLAAASLSIEAGGRRRTLVHLEDFIIGRNAEDRTFSVSAPLVYVGYGVSAPAEGIDDYKGLDVRGRIVVAFAGAPSSLSTEKRAYYSDKDVKFEEAAERGAIGFVSLPTKKSEEGTSWSRSVAHAEDAGMAIIRPDGSVDQVAPQIRGAASLSAAGAAALFEGGAVSFAALQAGEADGKGAPAGFALEKIASIAGANNFDDVTSPNVIGIIEGSDPVLRDEVVVISAHLDHVGVDDDAKKGEDNIYNGALDNSVGVSVLIEAARAFQNSGEKPRRSIAFVALTAEEKGLVGSDYLAKHSPFGAKKMVANVNLDMPVVLYDFKDVVAFGAERSSIGGVVDKAAQSMGLKLSPDPIPEENLFVRSDHYSFVKQGVPAVFLILGFENGGEKKFRKFLDKHYHQPSDDVKLPINYKAAARFTELNYRVARDLANAEERPAWVKGDFFGERFSK